MKRSLLIQLVLVALSLCVLLYVGFTQNPPRETPVEIVVPFGEGGELRIVGSEGRERVRRLEPEPDPPPDEPVAGVETTYQAGQTTAPNGV